jgi:hypothetical protein
MEKLNILTNDDQTGYTSLEDLFIAYNHPEPSLPIVIPTSNSVPIDWEQRRYELIKAAMQGMMSRIDPDSFTSIDAANCCEIADEIIKELKGENK